MQQTPLPVGLQGALLFELNIAERQLLGLANAIPAESFTWRPCLSVRSVSEVLVHVGAGNFFLLEVAGRPAPPDIYGHIAVQGDERLWIVARRNDELEKAVADKPDVLALLTRSLTAVREAISDTDEAGLAEPLLLRAYMRQIAHSHEHMGQMIAYTRMLGLPVPWPDWRPDRRG
jgi:uncharacterized damage-inducible protein DinB